MRAPPSSTTSSVSTFATMTVAPARSTPSGAGSGPGGSTSPDPRNRTIPAVNGCLRKTTTRQDHALHLRRGFVERRRPRGLLAAGWWLVYPPGESYDAVDTAMRGVFIDGPELDPATPPDLHATGTATYIGGAGDLADTSEFTEFQGTISFKADFDHNRLTGCLGCIKPIETAPGRHLFRSCPGRVPVPPRRPPTTTCASRLPSAPGARSTIRRSPQPTPNARSRCRDVARSVFKRAGYRRALSPSGRPRPMSSSPSRMGRAGALRASSMHSPCNDGAGWCRPDAWGSKHDSMNSSRGDRGRTVDSSVERTGSLRTATDAGRT